MNIREVTENNEKLILSKYATLSKDSMGREVNEEKCDLRTEFQRDRDRIIHSQAFRRLKHKTQVFIAPSGDHFRTRLTHTLEVSQIARSISRFLRLNEDLTEAIALSHDLGHTPFGHSGETVLNKLHPNGFKHYEQSVRVVKFVENRNGKTGLNLTFEVLDGIRNHSGKNTPKTLEAKVVKIADRIAYINHDIDDAIDAKVISLDDIPKNILDNLGYSNSDRINTLISDLVENSLDKDDINMSIKVYQDMMDLRAFMFKNVYQNPVVKSQEDRIKRIIEDLYFYFLEDIYRIPKSLLDHYDLDNTLKEDIICDYIASMTDTYIINFWKDLYIPRGWKG